ncbi:peptidase associated/transthyretin-like domain-containing protein [Flavitalea sp.]|nr:hypothetical protein [Flavitalea sp.]
MKITLFIILLLISAPGFSQPVNGYVFGSDKKPLDGATVALISKGTHSHTNEYGFFS